MAHQARRGVEILLYGIARQRIHHGGRVVDLTSDSEWRTLVRSLKRHVPLTRPPLRRDHDPRTSGALGYVTEVVGPVSRAQLVRGGVPREQLPHEEYMLFRAELTPRGERQYNGGDIARTSIGLEINMVDDGGRRWPYFLDHLGLVDRPHIRVQPTAQELSGVALRAGARRTLYLSGAAIQRRKGMLTDEQKGRLAEGIAALVADLLSAEGPTMEAADEVAEETAEEVLDTLEAGDPEEEVEMAYDEEKERLKTELAAANEKIVRLQFGARLKASGVKLSAEEMKDVLALAARDPQAADLALRLSARSGTSRRIAAPGAAPAPASDNPQARINARLTAALKNGGE